MLMELSWSNKPIISIEHHFVQLEHFDLRMRVILNLVHSASGVKDGISAIIFVGSYCSSYQHGNHDTKKHNTETTTVENGGTLRFLGLSRS